MKHYDDDESKKVKNNNKIVDSFNNAINGIVESVNTERNMAFHIFAAIVVMVACFFLDFNRVELILIGLTVVFVLVTELINTSIEVLTDLVTDGKYHDLAKKVKDIAAGAVLLSSIVSVFVAYLLIYPKISNIVRGEFILVRITKNVEHLAVLSVMIVLLVTVLLKGIFFKKDTTPLFGGSISGHSALAFNLATIGSVVTKNFILIIIFYLLAIIVAESRYESKIHSLKEVVLGALLGVVVALALFYGYI